MGLSCTSEGVNSEANSPNEANWAEVLHVHVYQQMIAGQRGETPHQ